MKIAFANHSFILGSGIDHVTYNLARELGKRHDVKVLTYASEIKGNNFEVVNIKLPMATNRIVSGILSPLYLDGVHDMRKIIKNQDAVITQMYPANLLPLLPSKISKSVYIEWGVQSTNLFDKPMEKAYMWGLHKAHGYAIKHSDIVITPSVEVGDMVRYEYGRRPVRLNLYGIDLDYFNYAKTSPDVVYEKHPQLIGKKIVLYAGRVSPHKNITMLVAAMQMVKEAIPDARLLLVGRPSFPEYDKEIDELIIARGMENYVVRAGLVSKEDLPSYFKCASLFCVCSAWEGFLIPEPLAMHLPMVCYDTPTHRQTVDDYVTGRLVKDFRTMAFAAAIIELLEHENRLKEMGECAYDKAVNVFDYKVIARKLEEVLSGNWN